MLMTYIQRTGRKMGAVNFCLGERLFRQPDRARCGGQKVARYVMGQGEEEQFTQVTKPETKKGHTAMQGLLRACWGTGSRKTKGNLEEGIPSRASPVCLGSPDAKRRSENKTFIGRSEQRSMKEVPTQISPFHTPSASPLPHSQGSHVQPALATPVSFPRPGMGVPSNPDTRPRLMADRRAT